MTQTLEERTLDLIAEFKRDYDIDADDDGFSTLRDRITEHLRAVERAATKAAYERAATICGQHKDERDSDEDEEWSDGYDNGASDCAAHIRALADGGSDG